MIAVTVMQAPMGEVWGWLVASGTVECLEGAARPERGRSDLCACVSLLNDPLFMWISPVAVTSLVGLRS